MENNNNDGQEVIETPAQEETLDTTNENVESQKIAELEKVRAELEEKNKKLYARLQKKEEKESKTNDRLDLKDIVALKNIHEDDIEEVQKFSDYQKKPIYEVVKDDTLKTILSVRAEKRKSAELSNTKTAQQGARQETDDEVLSAARRGEEVDVEKLADAQMRKKTAHLK